LRRLQEVLKVSRKPDGRPEIFYSVQGEGVNIGKPAVFLRLGLCNLACTWCDTKYTWDWNNYNKKDHIIEMGVEEVEREVLRHSPKFLVLTGGEPMIQQNQLIPLLGRLKHRAFFIEVETNGTIMPSEKMVDLIDHWSISPKLNNSGNPLSSREIPDSYRFFAGLSSSHFKFVVQNENDFDEIQPLMSKYHLTPDRAILMPEAQSRAGLIERSEWVVELCKRTGCIFSTRLQILLWGNQRGV
jgi:7-cyano-7-deazaguanosine (preQ0) biosynthesis protein QueE